LLVERDRRRRFADPPVPIAGVALVAFLAMKIGVHGHSGRIVARLRAFMRLVPVALCIPPQRLQREAKAVRRHCRVGRLAERSRIHRAEPGSRDLLRRILSQTKWPGKSRPIPQILLPQKIRARAVIADPEVSTGRTQPRASLLPREPAAARL